MLYLARYQSTFRVGLDPTWPGVFLVFKAGLGGPIERYETVVKEVEMRHIPMSLLERVYVSHRGLSRFMRQDWSREMIETKQFD